MYVVSSKVGGKRGKSRKWRAAKRRQAEAEAAERERERRHAQRTVRGRRIEGADARARFAERQVIFAECFGRVGRLVHALAWLLHNCVAHPLLGLWPGRVSVWVHDRTADWLNQSPIVTDSPLPEIGDRRAWLLHNCVAHPLMGLAPLARPFELHESSATRMQVDGWV